MRYPKDRKPLRKKCVPVTSVDSRVRKLITDLKDTLMHHPEGVGLAAPQINRHERVVVVRLVRQNRGTNEHEAPIALVNPAILEAEDEQPDFDGCLSFPGIYGTTVRPHSLKVTGMDEHGARFDSHYEGFNAVLVHHEIDHLDGILFIDRAKSLADLYTITENEFGEPVRQSLSESLSASLNQPPLIKTKDEVRRQA